MKALSFQSLVIAISVFFWAFNSNGQSISGEAALEIIASNLEVSTPISDFKFESVTVGQNGQVSNRDYYSLKIIHEKSETISLLLSGPKGFLSSTKPHPTLFVTAGFTVGQDAILLLDQNTDCILIGYNYPYDLARVKKDPSLFLKTLRLVPGQISLALSFIQAQPWLGSLHTVGISLGGLFLPVSQHLAMKLGVTVKTTILGFTGNDISQVASFVLKDEMPIESIQLISSVLQNLLTLHDPKIHLPYLTGPFLVLTASNDQLFSKENSEGLFKQLAYPKSQLQIQGPHIDLDQPSVIHQTQKIISGWLTRHGIQR